ncbi:MAG: spore germination protein [Oscillospiraceae bacterium]|nr:spore germination protein [Oscillospiraceae bacterium]
MNDFVASLLEKNVSIKERKIYDISVLFVPQIVDRNFMADFLIRPLVETKEDKTFDNIMNKILCIDAIEAQADFNQIEEFVLNGHAVIVVSNEPEYIVVDTKRVENRGVSSPQISFSLRGPKDSLNESLGINLSLLRYRIKDNRLQTENFKVGRRTKTNVSMFYMQDVANDNIVAEVRKRIADIDVDGILDSGELQQFLTKGKFQVFPQLGVIERSDTAAGAILEGKVVLLVEGSGLALVCPKVLVEYFASSDDYYDNKFFGTYSKIIRYISLFAMVLLMPLYVAAVTFKLQYFTPFNLELVHDLRQNVPFSPMIEALLAVFIIELLREGLLRVPRDVGGAIGIAAGVILGDAIISGGILSIFTLIIATLSLLMSFTPSDFTIAHPFRIFQPILIILAGFFGFWGVAGGLSFLLLVLAFHKSFGVPFLAPIIPFYGKDFLGTYYNSKTDIETRPRFFWLKDKRRSKRN